MARHLPHDALGNLMDLSMSSGVQLSTVYVSQVKPFSATLMAKVPQRDGETGTVPPAAAAPKDDTGPPASSPPEGTAVGSPAAAAAAAAGSEDAWIDGGAAAAAAAAAAATAADKAAEEAAAAGKAVPETPVSPSVPGTTMGSGFGRPRLGVSKIAETTNSFVALGLALRYPSTRIFVRADLLAAGGSESAMGKKRSSLSSFDAADLAELYPDLMRLKDAKERRSASEKMDSQFEMQKIRQQLESAVSLFLYSSGQNLLVCLFGAGAAGATAAAAAATVESSFSCYYPRSRRNTNTRRRSVFFAVLVCISNGTWIPVLSGALLPPTHASSASLFLGVPTSIVARRFSTPEKSMYSHEKLVANYPNPWRHVFRVCRFLADERGRRRQDLRPPGGAQLAGGRGGRYRAGVRVLSTHSIGRGRVYRTSPKNF